MAAMEGLKRGIFRSIAVFVAALVLILFILDSRFRRFDLSAIFSPDFDAPLMVAGAAAFCVWFASIYVTSLFRTARDRSLLRLSHAGAPPADGKRGAFTGRIEARDLLRAPITGATVAAFRYEIFEWRSSGLSSQRSSITKFTHFQGSALVPLNVVTASGSFPLACFPEIEMPEAVRDRKQGIANFRRYQAETPIDPPQRAGTPQPRRNVREVGVHRFDREWTQRAELDWQKAELREWSLSPGDSVTIFAHYASGRGIVSDPRGIDLPLIYREGEETELRLSANWRRGVIGTLIFLVVAAAIVLGFATYRARAERATVSMNRQQASITRGEIAPRRQ